MKSRICLMLAVLLCFSLAACNKEPSIVITEGTPPETTQTIPEKGDTDMTATQTFTMMGHNLLQSFIKENKRNAEAPFAILPTARAADFLSAIGTHHPDILAVQECDEGWHDCIDGPEGLSALGYAPATDGFTDEDLRMIRNVLYYDTAKFTVVDAGYETYEGTAHGEYEANPWCFTWAVLESRENACRFAVSSTHLVWGSIDNFAQRDAFAKQQSAFLSDLAARYAVGVIAMGDYNAHMGEPAYHTMKAAFASARETAETLRNMEYNTDKPFGKAPALADEAGHGLIDHCFYSPDALRVLTYETMLGEEVLVYTDHCPQWAQFALK